MDIAHKNPVFVLILLLRFSRDASPFHCPSTNLSLE